MNLPEEFTANLKRMAEGNSAQMDGTTGPVFTILDGADVVFGVWDDPATPRGFDFRIVKGHEVLQECVASGKTITPSITAIKCISPEQAVALERGYAEREHGKGH